MSWLRWRWELGPLLLLGSAGGASKGENEWTGLLEEEYHSECDCEGQSG